MSVVRVVAAVREGGRKDSQYKVVLLCQIDGANRIVPGEWMGYVKNESYFHPFVFQRSAVFYYGGEEHWAEPTNIGQRDISVGSFFTLSNDPKDTDSFEATYEITSVHPVGG